MKKLLLTVLLASGILTFACGKAGPPPEPPVVILKTDGGAFDEPHDDAASGGYANPKCAKACAHLQDLDCPDGFRRPGEDTCYVVCRRAEESGKISFHLDCVIAAKTQDDVRACKSYRCR